MTATPGRLLLVREPYELDLEAVPVRAVVEKRTGGRGEQFLGHGGRQDDPVTLHLFDPQVEARGHPQTVQEERRHKDLCTTRRAIVTVLLGTGSVQVIPLISQ